MTVSILSSAYYKNVLFGKSFDVSAEHSLNKNGSHIDPCGTPKFNKAAKL